MGAPSKFTKARIQLILEGVRSGMSIARAAARARLDDSTVSKWASRGEADMEDGKDNPYVRFFNDLKEAESECELVLVLTIKNASKTQWQAGAWLLERKWPTEWGRRDRVDLGADAGPGQGGQQAILEIHLPAKKELPDGIQVQGPGPKDEGKVPGAVQQVDGGNAGLRQPARKAGPKAKGATKGKKGSSRRPVPPPAQ